MFLPFLLYKLELELVKTLVGAFGGLGLLGGFGAPLAFTASADLGIFSADFGTASLSIFAEASEAPEPFLAFAERNLYESGEKSRQNAQNRRRSSNSKTGNTLHTL